jgi:hypothetical protein
MADRRPAPERDRPAPRRRDDDEGDRRPVVGFGGDLPAFLARPVSVPPADR